MKRLIRKFFKCIKTTKPNKEEVNWRHQYIDNIISKVETYPETFSATWFSNTLSKSIINENRNIQIMIETGEIILPIDFSKHMTPEQKQRMITAMKPIVDEGIAVILRDFEE